MSLTFIAPEVLFPSLHGHIAARRDFCRKLLEMDAMDTARLLPRDEQRIRTPQTEKPGRPPKK